MTKRRTKARRCLNPDVPGGCPNLSTQGRFIGDLCVPCYERRLRDLARACALAGVLAERTAQDVEWGGAKHDDQHTLADWNRFLIRQTRHIGVLTLRAKLRGKSLLPGAINAEEEARLVKVCALALAALESVYRVRGLFSPEDLKLAFGASPRPAARKKARRRS